MAEVSEKVSEKSDGAQLSSRVEAPLPARPGFSMTSAVANQDMFTLWQSEVMTSTLTEARAKEMPDPELERNIVLLRTALSMASFMTADAVRHNLGLLVGEHNRRRPGAAAVPTGGLLVNRPGIVAWAGDPELRLRTEPAVADVDNIIRTLPFNTRLTVIKEFPGDWYFVSTADGDLGYAAFRQSGLPYIRTDLPEPTARLHKVESGVAGTAIAIAERYYGAKADNWGQDLRFYVNVLAWVNKISVPDTTSGWKSVHFQAGQVIWIPGQQFALTLKGIVNSGSTSYNIADAVGVAELIERIGELIEDVGTAIEISLDYMAESIQRHCEEAMWGVLEGLAQMIVMSAALLAVLTAIGAAIGGGAPGAALGFEVGMALLEWMGLAMFVVALAQAMVAVGDAIGKFLAIVWEARGDRQKLDEAGRMFAEGVGILIGKLLEALISYVIAKGMGGAMKSLRGTKLGSSLADTRAATWLETRARNVASGNTPLPGPQKFLRRPRVAEVAGERAAVTTHGNAADFHALPQDRLPGNLPEGHFWARSDEGHWVLMREPGAPPATFELSVYSDGTATNYALSSNNRTIATDALTRQGSTYARGQQRTPDELAGTGPNNPYRDPATGQLYDKGHGVDYADNLEGPGVRSSNLDPRNFTPQATWWNQGPRKSLVGRIRSQGGGYREMPIYGTPPRTTVNGTPIPTEFVFVETNRAGVPQQAWRVPNDPSLTDRTMGALGGRGVPLNEVPAAILRPGALTPDVPGISYTPGLILGHRGDDEGQQKDK